MLTQARLLVPLLPISILIVCSVRCFSQAATGNVRVLCRIRPVLGGAAASTIPVGPTSLQVMNGAKAQHTFEYDRVLGPQSTQQDVFEELEPLIADVWDGYNACILAYGQTGAGKVRVGAWHVM